MRARRPSLRAVAFYGLLILLAMAALVGMVSAYLLYRDTLQEAQERNLTTMAEAASSNLTGYFDRRMEELDLQFSDSSVSRAVALRKGDLAAALDDLLADLPTPPAAVQVVFEPLASSDVETAGSADAATSVTSWYRSDAAYRLVLERPVRLDGRIVGHVVETLDLNAVYDEVLASVQVGEMGYCMVKDPNKVVVMHKVASQIGVDTQVERVEGHPEGDWDELFAHQYSGEAGCDIVASYWWDDLEAGLALKFIAYAPAYIDGNYFVANVVMAYDELMQPLQRMLVLCTVLGAIVLVAFVAAGWRLAKGVQRARHLRRELAYEQELRIQTQRIKLQEHQIQQIDRLQTMGIVTSSFAHELKNLMTPLSIYGQLLQDESLSDSERQEVSQEVEKLADRCSDMLRRMLSYVRQRQPEARAPFDATAAVKEALVLIRPLVPRNVRLEDTVSDQPCPLRGDAASVGQIMLNLVTNALYAMRGQGGELGISWMPDPVRRATFVLRVSDTGCGMTDDVRRSLFTSFFTTKGDEGTGLGMSVVLALVQSMRGSIEVASTLGEGSMFTVLLPVAEGEGTDTSMDEEA